MNNIIYDKSLNYLNNKYKNRINKLLKISKKEVDAVDKAINFKNKSILNKGKWWYIKENDSYYQKPRLFSITWFKTLNIVVKTSLCLVLAGGITCATVLPLCLNKNTNKYASYSVACVGDSITWGTTSFIGTQMDEPYPIALKNAIGFGHVSNYGIPSSTLCNDLKESEKYKPEQRAYAPMVERIKTIASSVNLIIIWGGINDVDRNCDIGAKGSEDPQNVYGALDSMCKYLNTKFSNSFVMFMTPLPAKYNGEMYYADEIVEAMNYTCNKYKYPVLDLTHNSNFEDEINSGKTDGVHPGEEWNKKVLVPKIVSFIKEHL